MEWEQAGDPKNNHISHFGYARMEMAHMPEAGTLCRVDILYILF